MKVMVLAVLPLLLFTGWGDQLLDFGWLWLMDVLEWLEPSLLA